MTLSPACLQEGVVATVALTAAVTDLCTTKIPKWLTVPAACVGLVGHLAIGGRAGLVGALAGLVIAAAVPLMLYYGSKGRAIGGGDLKLLAALGAIAGPGLGLEIELSTFMALAGIVLLRLAYDGKLLRVLANAFFIAMNPFLPKRLRRTIVPEALTEMRLGPAIALGTALTLLAAHLETVAPWLA